MQTNFIKTFVKKKTKAIKAKKKNRGKEFSAHKFKPILKKIAVLTPIRFMM